MYSKPGLNLCVSLCGIKQHSEGDMWENKWQWIHWPVFPHSLNLRSCKCVCNVRKNIFMGGGHTQHLLETRLGFSVVSGRVNFNSDGEVQTVMVRFIHFWFFLSDSLLTTLLFDNMFATEPSRTEWHWL